MAEVVISGMVEGGKATSGPPFGPALGPLGVNISGIIDQINKSTETFNGIKIPVKVIVNTENKSFRIEVGSPTTSALILKELGIAAGAKTKDETVGNLTLDQVKAIAKAKDSTIYGKSAADKVKQILGTCKSMGVKCDNQSPMDVIKKIDSGEIKI